MYKSLSVIQRQLHDVNRQGEMLSAQILARRELRNRCQGFWNFFRRRALTAEIKSNAHRATCHYHAVGRAYRRNSVLLQLLIHRSLPALKRPPSARSICSSSPTRRSCICILPGVNSLPKLREAAIMQVTDVQFGDRRACREISRQVENRVALLQNEQHCWIAGLSSAQFISPNSPSLTVTTILCQSQHHLAAYRC